MKKYNWLHKYLLNLVLILSANFSFAQWSISSLVNTKVSVAPNDQQDERIASDGKNGAIMIWEDFRNDILKSAIYIQRIKSSGTSSWPANGIPVCETPGINHSSPALTEDGNSGAIAVWQDWRNGTKDIFAQRVDSNGNMQWTTGGVPVAVKTYDQQDPRIVNDGANGAIIVWQDSVNGNWDIFVQRIDASGNALWTTGGVAICTAIDNQVSPHMDNDGSGGAFITWQDHRNGSNYDIYAQHISAGGVCLWTPDGVAVCALPGSQKAPKIKHDNSAGAYVSWTDKRNGTDYDMYAQHLSASGTAFWTANGICICSAPGDQNAQDMTTGSIPGVVISWEDFRTGAYSDIYCQKLDENGLSQWTVNGLAVVTGGLSQMNIDMSADGNGGVVINWEDSIGNSWDVYSQKLNASGVKQWGVNGIALGTANGNQTRPKSVSDGNGGGIFVFQDKRNGTDFDLYAQHIKADGTVDIVQDMEYSAGTMQVVPQPSKNKTDIYSGFVSSSSGAKIFDILGNDVTSSFSIVSVAEGRLNVTRLSAEEGLYVIRVENENGNSASAKLIFQN